MKAVYSWILILVYAGTSFLIGMGYLFLSLAQPASVVCIFILFVFALLANCALYYCLHRNEKRKDRPNIAAAFVLCPVDLVFVGMPWGVATFLLLQDGLWASYEGGSSAVVFVAMYILCALHLVVRINLLICALRRRKTLR